MCDKFIGWTRGKCQLQCCITCSINSSLPAVVLSAAVDTPAPTENMSNQQQQQEKQDPEIIEILDSDDEVIQAEPVQATASISARFTINAREGAKKARRNQRARSHVGQTTLTGQLVVPKIRISSAARDYMVNARKMMLISNPAMFGLLEQPYSTALQAMDILYRERVLTNKATGGHSYSNVNLHSVVVEELKKVYLIKLNAKQQEDVDFFVALGTTKQCKVCTVPNNNTTDTINCIVIFVFTQQINYAASVHHNGKYWTLKLPILPEYRVAVLGNVSKTFIALPAHHIAWLTANYGTLGLPAMGHSCSHLCQNPKCVTTDHLFFENHSYNNDRNHCEKWLITVKADGVIFKNICHHQPPCMHRGPAASFRINILQ